MNVHDEIKKLAPNLHKPFKDGDMYYAGNDYPTEERVRINRSGAIVLKIDSKIGKYFSKILEQNHVSYREESGLYKSYSAKNLRNAGLLNLQSTAQNSEFSAEEVLEPEKHDVTSIEEDIAEIISNEKRDLTEKVQFINARIGQGQFRKSLLSYWGKCAVTGVSYSAMLLASHIKPWSKSNDYERLDQFNGLLLTPNLDRAFDQGLISFEETGSILLSKALKDDQKLGINSEMSIELINEHQQYMRFHRENVFKNT